MASGIASAWQDDVATEIAPAAPSSTLPTGAGPAWLAVALAAVLAASPVAQGYFDFELWGVLALGMLVVVIVLLRVRVPVLRGSCTAATAGLGLLLVLSAASWLWAESKEAVWTETNRLALYCAVFAIVVLAVRRRDTARTVMIILGAAALIVSLWLCASMLLGAASADFASHRLDAPIDYVNADAALLVMGLWPWVALAETARRPVWRAGSLGAAALIGCTAVLTQSRALLPATVAAVILVLCCTGSRTTRALNILLVAASVAVSLPWTLRVYSAGGVAARSLPPADGVLRAGGIAIVAASLGCALVRLIAAHYAGRLGVQRSRRLQRGVGIALLLAAGPLLAAGLVVAAPSISRQYDSFTAMRFNDAAPVRILDAGGYRYDLWRVAVREFERHPLTGLGAGNYDVEYYRLRRNPEYVRQPHSLALQVAAELGIGGILGLVLFAGAVVWACFTRRGTLAAGDVFVRVAAAGMFAAWLAGTSVDWLYDIPGITAMAIVAAALLVLRVDAPVRRVRRGTHRLVWAAGLAVVAVLAASIGRQYAGIEYAKRGTRQIAHSPRQAISTLLEAVSLDPYSLPARYALAAAYAELNDYRDAHATLLAAAERERHNFVAPALLGDLERRRGAPDVAAADYARAAALDPHDVRIHPTLTRARGAR
jgi:O-antigen ligase